MILIIARDYKRAIEKYSFCLLNARTVKNVKNAENVRKSGKFKKNALLKAGHERKYAD